MNLILGETIDKPFLAELKEIKEKAEKFDKIKYRINQFRIEDGIIQDRFAYDALRKILEESKND